VVDDATGKGIAGVEIQAGPANDAAVEADFLSPSVWTDADGRFRIPAAAGKRRVILVGPVSGYDAPSQRALDRRPGKERFERTIEVVSGQPQPELRFELGQGLIVEGTVVDPEGKPAAGAEVEVMLQRPRSDDGRATRTDASGRFRLSGLSVVN